MNLDQLSLDPNMHIHCHWIRWIWIRYYCIRIFCRWFRIRWIRCRWIHCCWIRWSLGPVVVAFIGPNIPKSLIYLASLIDKRALTTLTQTHTIKLWSFWFAVWISDMLHLNTGCISYIDRICLLPVFWIGRLHFMSLLVFQLCNSPVAMPATASKSQSAPSIF